MHVFCALILNETTVQTDLFTTAIGNLEVEVISQFSDVTFSGFHVCGWDRCWENLKCCLLNLKPLSSIRYWVIFTASTRLLKCTCIVKVSMHFTVIVTGRRAVTCRGIIHLQTKQSIEDHHDCFQRSFL